MGQLHCVQLLFVILPGLAFLFRDIDNCRQNYILLFHIYNIYQRRQVILRIRYLFSPDTLMRRIDPLEIFCIDKLKQVHLDRFGPGLAKIFFTDCGVL